jgi:hypothetical protein
MGMPIPKSIQNAPDLFLGLEIYWVGFLDLANDRPIGMEEGMISWATVEHYARALDFNSEQTEDLHFHITALDVARSKHGDQKRIKADGKSGGFRT